MVLTLFLSQSCINNKNQIHTVYHYQRIPNFKKQQHSMMQAQSKASGNMVFKNTSKDIANTFSTSMCMFHVNPKR